MTVRWTQFLAGRLTLCSLAHRVCVSVCVCMYLAIIEWSGNFYYGSQVHKLVRFSIFWNFKGGFGEVLVGANSHVRVRVLSLE